jgi:uncharacterized protein
MRFWKNAIRTGPSTLNSLNGKIMDSNIKAHAFRLKPHEDLKKCILDFARTRQIKAGIILTCVGSLEHYHIRFANEKTGSRVSGYFEIVSLTGTFSDSAAHLHISVSDNTGKTTGGHLLDDSFVYTTAEVVIGELPDLLFERVEDPTYKYLELLIKKSPSK